MDNITDIFAALRQTSDWMETLPPTWPSFPPSDAPDKRSIIFFTDGNQTISHNASLERAGYESEQGMDFTHLLADRDMLLNTQGIGSDLLNPTLTDLVAQAAAGSSALGGRHVPFRRGLHARRGGRLPDRRGLGVHPAYLQSGARHLAGADHRGPPYRAGRINLMARGIDPAFDLWASAEPFALDKPGTTKIIARPLHEGKPAQGEFQGSATARTLYTPTRILGPVVGLARRLDRALARWTRS